jgi:hypothetical protein
MLWCAGHSAPNLDFQVAWVAWNPRRRRRVHAIGRCAARGVKLIVDNKPGAPFGHHWLPFFTAAARCRRQHTVDAQGRSHDSNAMRMCPEAGPELAAKVACVPAYLHSTVELYPGVWFAAPHRHRCVQLYSATGVLLAYEACCTV